MNVKVSLTIPGLVLALMVVGCAKRPATTQAAAAAPAGAVGSAATAGGPAAGSGPAGSMSAQSGSRPTGPTATASAGATAAPTVRETVRESSATPGLRSIHFDYDKYDIRPGDAKVLEANAAWLKANSTQVMIIEGHCDERGTNEYNVALGERRAKAALDYLVSQGVQASRMTIISYGEQRPLCTAHNEACWARNRRAQFAVKLR